MNTLKTIGISAVVALVVAIGISFTITPEGKTVERVTQEKLGAFAGPDVLFPVEFKDGLFATASGTAAIGTTTRVSTASNQGGLILEGTNATPTVAFFATSTISGSATWSSTSAGSGCIQFNSGTTSGQYFRLYVGEVADAANTPSLDGRGLIFEAGACQE